MKTITQLLALVLIVTSTACSKSDDSASPADPSATLKQEISKDSWIVSSYIDKGKNETSDYSGYTFTFSDNGTLTANNSGMTFTGTWRIGSNHNGSDDSGNHSGNDNKLIMTISGNDQMDELTDDFLIVSISVSEIALKDDNLTKIKELKFAKK
jgi:hypothetical protein